MDPCAPRESTGDSWHPSTDNLAGKDVYGIKPGWPGTGVASTSDATFSVPYSHLPFTKFLFATGDQAKWMVVEPSAIGAPFNPTATYSNSPRDVVMSSENSSPHQVKWSNREIAEEDPTIHLMDSGAWINDQVLYLENKQGGTIPTTMMSQHNGANVYVYVPPYTELGTQEPLARKFSAVLGVTSALSSMTMRPMSFPLASMSINTTGLDGLGGPRGG